MSMGHWVVGGITIGQANTWVLITAIVLFILFTIFFRFTSTGKQVQAICESHVIAQSVGIDVKRVLSLVWVIACICAALTGVLVGATGSVGIYLNELVFMVIPTPSARDQPSIIRIPNLLSKVSQIFSNAPIPNAYLTECFLSYSEGC